MRAPTPLPLSIGSGFYGQLIQVGTICGLYALSLLVASVIRIRWDSELIFYRLVLEREYLMHCYQQFRPPNAESVGETPKKGSLKNEKKKKSQ